MRLHSVASKMYIPGSREELLSLIKELKILGEKYYLLSGGSNIVFAERIGKPIINLMEIDNSLSCSSDGIIRAGASVRIQKLIRFCQRNNYGGVEYLFSVPSSVGGAIYMNAGRGKKYNLSISDYILEVEYLDPTDLQCKIYRKQEGDFSHRHSPFQGKNWILLSAKFKFLPQQAEVTEKLIKNRILHSALKLSPDKPSCGSVFCKGNRFIYRIIMGMRIGGAEFSKKTPNWISNVNEASSKDIRRLVNRAILLHKIFFSKYRVEIRFFD